MKKIIFMLVGFMFLFSACTDNYQEKEHDSKSEGHSYNVDFSLYELSNLTKDEILEIKHMREEEKLARDVYRTLSKTTNSRVFNNIPVSEQKHMDVFYQLIVRYNLEDPVKDETKIGIYTDKSFTKLYNDLIKKGQKSDRDAYEVGAMVEDINMFNLIKYGKKTDKADLKLAYSTLLTQSKNHMTAFIKNLKKEGGTFKPTYLSQKQFEDSILNKRGFN
jgi:hypothetical protein